MIETQNSNALDVFNDLSIEQKKSVDVSQAEADKNQFLELMIAQLENQDPLSPQEGGEFLSQLAQFSTVEGIDTLNASMSDLASGFRSGQALQATALVGRSVEVPHDVATIDTGESLTGSIELPYSAGNVRVNISHASGEWVRSLSLGTHSAGQIPFDWDGLDDQGDAVPPGDYVIEAIAASQGEDIQLQTYLAKNVNSVTIDTLGEVTVNVDGVGSVSLNDVRSIQ